jgi:diguanylate cyclase (GGDEF)-like protein
VISLKKYLDTEPDRPFTSEPNPEELLAAALHSYRSVLLAMGDNGARACPAIGPELQHGLASLESRLCGNLTPSLMAETEDQVEEQLQQWARHTANHLKAKANEVKELLIVLARTAESLGERDQRYANQITQFTSRLQVIADLEDLTQVRASLVQRATELKTYVERMEKDSHQAIAQLRAEVSTYESKLKAAEELALRDVLTGLANRRNVEERIAWRIAHQQMFCVIILDLNRFKLINDRYGHLAGDSVLKQFSQELSSNLRSADLVGRWSGDEFIAVLDCDLAGATSQVARMREWVFGEYTVQLGSNAGKTKINVDAAVGVAQWKPGETIQAVIERADTAMYEEKKLSRNQELGRRASQN